jgi:hypothetical protein
LENSPVQEGKSGPTPPGRPIVKIDNYVRRQTESVDLETLNRKGVTRLNLLTYSKLNELISLAVLRSFQKYRRNWDEEEAREIGDEARSGLERTLTEAESTAKEAVDEGREALQADLGKLRPLVTSRLEELRREDAGEDPVLQVILEETIGEMEGLVRAAVGRAAGGGDSRPDLAALEADLRGVVRRILDIERSRLQDILGKINAEKTEVLQRRLEKLQAHLAEMEEALKALALAKGYDPGIPSVYRAIQGLCLDDNRYEKKKKMLQVIFEENLDLQKAVGHE